MNHYDAYGDEVLVALLKQNDREAFSAIYLRYSSVLYQYAFNILREEQECLDAVQDIFVWLWTNRCRLNITALKAYLLAAVKYKLISAIRISKRRQEILSERSVASDVMIDDSIEVKELTKVINDFVQSLPQKAREVYQLSREKYLTNKEIASRLNISEKTVENHITLTLRKLKLHLGKMSFWSVFL